MYERSIKVRLRKGSGCGTLLHGAFSLGRQGDDVDEIVACTYTTSTLYLSAFQSSRSASITAVYLQTPISFETKQSHPPTSHPAMSKTPGGAGASEKFMKQQAQSKSATSYCPYNCIRICPTINSTGSPHPFEQNTVKALPTLPATPLAKHQVKYP